MKRKLLALVVLVAALLLSGCCGPDPILVRAQRATFDAVAPEYLRYVTADPALAPPDLARRQLTVQTWDDRIRAQEARLSQVPGLPLPPAPPTPSPVPAPLPTGGDS